MLHQPAVIDRKLIVYSDVKDDHTELLKGENKKMTLEKNLACDGLIATMSVNFLIAEETELVLCEGNSEPHEARSQR